MEKKKYYSIVMLCIDTDDTTYTDTFTELFNSEEEAIKALDEAVSDFIEENNSMGEDNMDLTGYYGAGDKTQRQIYYDDGYRERLITEYTIFEHYIGEEK